MRKLTLFMMLALAFALSHVWAIEAVAKPAQII